MLNYKIQHINKDFSQGYIAEIIVPSDSIWFSGHFPNMPILPGVAQISIIKDIIKKIKGNNYDIDKIKKIRFKKIIKPNSKLKINILPNRNDELIFYFKLFTENEVACVGNIIMKKIDNYMMEEK